MAPIFCQIAKKSLLIVAILRCLIAQPQSEMHRYPEASASMEKRETSLPPVDILKANADRRRSDGNQRFGVGGARVLFPEYIAADARVIPVNRLVMPFSSPLQLLLCAVPAGLLLQRCLDDSKRCLNTELAYAGFEASPRIQKLL